MEFASYKEHKKEIKKLYKAAFPFDERFPLPFLKWKARGSDVDFSAVLDNGKFIGFSYTLESENFLYVYYLAVCEELRSRGYGSKILQAIKDKKPHRTVTLAIEDMSKTDAPNYDQRLRRLKFYQANGFQRLNLKINEVGVDLELLGTDDTVSYDEFMKMMKKFLGTPYFKFIYRKMEKKERSQ